MRMDSAAAFTGFSQSRVDGVLKVTGGARYAAEFHAPGLAFGCVASSAIPKGRITVLHTEAAAAVPGVLCVFSHKHHRHTAWLDHNYHDQAGPPGRPFRPFDSDKVYFS